MACPLSVELHNWVREHIFQPDVVAWLRTFATSFILIGAAEIGDKSQLVCMTLSARHRALPVFMGAVAAFVILNIAAVLVGAAVAEWIPRSVVLGVVAALFGLFGIMALWGREADDTVVAERPGHGIFVTTFLMILLAEFGDKTQLATAGLAVGTNVIPVWFGSTLALASACLVAVVAGRTVLQRVPVRRVRQASGLMFLALAAYTAWRLMPVEFVASILEAARFNVAVPR